MLKVGASTYRKGLDLLAFPLISCFARGAQSLERANELIGNARGFADVLTTSDVNSHYSLDLALIAARLRNLKAMRQANESNNEVAGASRDARRLSTDVRRKVEADPDGKKKKDCI